MCVSVCVCVCVCVRLGGGGIQHFSSGKLVDFPTIPLATREKRKRECNQHRSLLLNAAEHEAISDIKKR